MLQKLLIQNYAIIDEIEIQFSEGLNIITGETGAGKSILMGALGLILGGRADTSALLQKDKKSIVEGFFNVHDKKNVAAFLEQEGFDSEPTLIVRREISNAGKSRGFINDSPATLPQLKALASMLVDLHQQFDTLDIMASDFQRAAIDILANNEGVLQVYQTCFTAWKQCLASIQTLTQNKIAFEKEVDYHRFLLDELNELHLKENELEALEAEWQILSNATEIKLGLTTAFNALAYSEQPISADIKQVQASLQNIARLFPEVEGVVTRLKTLYIELKDIADELSLLSDKVNDDQARAAIVNERITAGNKLLRKHGLKHTHELLALQADLEKKLTAVLNIDDELKQQALLAKSLEKELLEHAMIIHKNRLEQVPIFEKSVNDLLAQVGMPNAQMKVSLETIEPSFFGTERIELLFDANKSKRFEPLSKVASGGELSRLMLCIKSMVATKIDLPTMIFDEIDTGISGEAAKQVGSIMKDMSAARQIICITHQPQIAGKASAHFYVYKDTRKEGIKTGIKQLSDAERVEAIAKMLSGDKPTTAALENAREMMN